MNCVASENRNLVTNASSITEGVVTSEIFGKNVKGEIKIATKALKDFARWIPSVRKDYIKLKAELDACTKCGDVARVMARVRNQYL